MNSIRSHLEIHVDTRYPTLKYFDIITCKAWNIRVPFPSLRYKRTGGMGKRCTCGMNCPFCYSRKTNIFIWEHGSHIPSLSSSSVILGFTSGTAANGCSDNGDGNWGFPAESSRRLFIAARPPYAPPTTRIRAAGADEAEMLEEIRRVEAERVRNEVKRNRWDFKKRGMK